MVVERRKCKKRKDDAFDGSTVTDKPSKEEYNIAKWIRINVRSKKTKFDRNHFVEYFTGTRAVDALLENSPWNKTIFESRQHVVNFLDTMLRHKFFHRAKKIVITEDELIRIKGIKKKNKDSKDFKEEKKIEREKYKEKNKDENNYLQEDKREDNEKQEKRKDMKKKPKVRLEMHMDQYFVDCNDAYVWIYEPIPVYYWFFGALLVLGAIGICLFPLWPLTVRHGVWYLSIAAAGFLIFILSLIVIRSIVFCLLWVLTIGRHHLWLLPNLVEDVGFFASFWPLYHYEYIDSTIKNKKSLEKKKCKKNKDKDSDVEDCSNTYIEEKSESSSEASKPNSPLLRVSASNGKNEILDGHEASEEDSESDKSNTGGDFEML